MHVDGRGATPPCTHSASSGWVLRGASQSTCRRRCRCSCTYGIRATRATYFLGRVDLSKIDFDDGKIKKLALAGPQWNRDTALLLVSWLGRT